MTRAHLDRLLAHATAILAPLPRQGATLAGTDAAVVLVARLCALGWDFEATPAGVRGCPGLPIDAHHTVAQTGALVHALTDEVRLVLVNLDATTVQ